MRMAARWRLAAGRRTPQDTFDPLAEGEWGPTRTRRAPSRGGDGRIRAAVRHPALARVPDGQRPPVQPDGRHRPERGWDQQRSVDRSGDRPAGLDQRGPGRHDGGRWTCGRRSSSRLGGERGSACLSRSSTCSTMPTSAEGYMGNGRSVLFREPSGGFIPGIGYPRQVQLGARFLF